MRYGHLREVVIEKPHGKFCGLQRERHKWEGPQGIIPWRGRYTNEYFALCTFEWFNELYGPPLHSGMVYILQTATECSATEAFQLQVSVRRLSDSAGRLVGSLSQTSKQPKLKTARWEAIWGASLLRELVPNSGRPGRGSARSVQKIAQEFRMNSTSAHLSERPTSRETPWGYGKDVHGRVSTPTISIIPVLYTSF